MKLNLPIDEIYQLYKKGMSSSDIASLHKCSENTINGRLRRYCKKNSLPLQKEKKMGDKEKQLRENIYVMYQNQKTIQEIATQLGCSYSTVYKKLHEYYREHKLSLRRYGRNNRTYSNPNEVSPTILSSSDQPTLYENDPNLEWNIKRKVLFSQLKSLLQISKSMNLENNDLVETLVKCKTRK